MKSSIYDKYDRIVFLDTETSGLDYSKNQIIELAMYSVNKDGTTAEYDHFVRLEREAELPERIIQLTGIMPLTLATKGIPEKAMCNDFTETAGTENKTLLVAYNAQFDLMFIAMSLVRQKDRDGLAVFNGCDYLDAMTVYKDRAEYPHKLEAAIKHYSLEDKVVNSHRAIDDTYALAAVFDAMADERDDLERYINLFGYNEKYGISGRKMKKITYMPQNMYSGIKDEVHALYAQKQRACTKPDAERSDIEDSHLSTEGYGKQQNMKGHSSGYLAPLREEKDPFKDVLS